LLSFYRAATAQGLTLKVHRSRFTAQGSPLKVHCSRFTAQGSPHKVPLETVKLLAGKDYSSWPGSIASGTALGMAFGMAFGMASRHGLRNGFEHGVSAKEGDGRPSLFRVKVFCQFHIHIFLHISEHFILFANFSDDIFQHCNLHLCKSKQTRIFPSNG
jgi:hypothetical protein